MFVLQLIGFGLTLWSGLYLLHRDWRNVRLALSGAALVVFSLGVGAVILHAYPPQGETAGKALAIVRDTAYWLPLLAWQGIVASLGRDQNGKHSAVWSVWKYGAPVFAAAAVILLIAAPNPGAYAVMNAVIGVAALGSAFLLSVWAVFIRPQTGTGLIPWLFAPLPPYLWTVIVIANGADISWVQGGRVLTVAALMLSALWILRTEIRSQGESWLPDLFRSMDYTTFFTLLFSGQVALAVHWGAGLHFSSAVLLLVSIAISVTFQVFAYSIRAALDRVAFATFPKLRVQSSQTRLVEIVQPRIDAETDPEAMSDEELFRFTRRALTHYSDLQRLAANPLTRLKWIDERLKERGAPDDVLERANELKSVMLECILQLKPRSDESFGTSDEWRYYNVLYFPYIIGIKPYSLRYSPGRLDEASLAALAWFREHVPERTYYNWQNAGAKIIAMCLRHKGQGGGN